MRISSGPCSRAIGLMLSLFIWITPVVAAQQTATPPASPSDAVPTAAVPRFTIYPVGDYANRWFEITLDAGASVELTAGIANSGDAPVSLLTYAANASSAPNGGFLAGSAGNPPAGPTTWVDYKPADLELAPGQAVEHAFTLTVPPDTVPGFYVVALVVQTADSLAVSGTDVLRQVIRNAVSVEITVPGDAVSGFELGTPAVSLVGDQWILDIPITNTGTTRLKPEGTLIVADADGNAVSTTDVTMESVYGGNTTSVRVVLPGQLPLGEYRVSLDLSDKVTGASDAIEDAPFTLGTPAAATPNARLDGSLAFCCGT